MRREDLAQDKHNVSSLPVPLDIQHIEPGRLHDVWPELRDDLEHCLSQDPDAPLVEDVYTLIKTGSWGLYVGTVRGAYVGFIVVQLVPEWSGGHRCHLLYVSGPGFLEQGNEYIETYARARGCRRITYRASKDGFARLTAKLGYRRISSDYEKRM